MSGIEGIFLRLARIAVIIEKRRDEMLLQRKTNKFCTTHYYGICWPHINITVGQFESEHK